MGGAIFCNRYCTWDRGFFPLWTQEIHAGIGRKSRFDLRHVLYYLAS